jgi:serine protease AprX
MQRMLLILIGILSAICSLPAQTRYLIPLKNKGFNTFSLSNPSAFLSARAIARRTQYNIALDSTDLPVTQRYVDSIRGSGAVTILNTSKWLNQVCIQTTDANALARIAAFPFVAAAPQPIGARVALAAEYNKVLETSSGTGITTPLTTQGLQDVINYGQAFNQINMHNGAFLHNHGFRGAGMVMAMMDGGFFRYQNLPVFDSMRLNNRVLGTWDFVANEAGVNEDHPHGMQCLSTISANLPGSFVGSAPMTSFYLFRTEDVASEYPVEEQNWAAAAERADSAGVQLFSVSLGYSFFTNPSYNYSYANMNGNTTLISRAADLAAKKGILVVVAAGNEGTSSWRFITAPADADSVLTIGAVTVNRQPVGFSSYGPSADGQVKPDLASVGQATVIANTSNGSPTFGNGTSYAAPNLAGLATCLWQAFPEVNNMTIIEAMRQSADRATIPDTRTGYGIPDMKKAFVLLLRRSYQQQSVLKNCVAKLNWRIKTDTSFRMIVERQLASESQFTTIATIGGRAHFTNSDFEVTDSLARIAFQPILYRIRVAIGTDTSFVLDSVLLNYNQPCPVSLVNAILVGPNPTGDILAVTVAREGASVIAICLYNAAGQLIHRERAQQAAGVVQYRIPMKAFSAGVYTVAVYVDEQRVFSKRVVR